MLPLLPRQMLWTDLKMMDEFFELDPLNESFYEVFVTLREEPFDVQTDGVKVFNEVYYQVTRMVYEHPLPIDLPKYINEIKANLGWNYSAELVMSMAYYMLSLIDKQERPLNRFFTKAINERFFGCLYWKPFKHRFEQLKKNKRHFKYSFQPCPYPPKYFTGKYVHWYEITQDYDLLTIKTLIALWSKKSDRRQVAEMIYKSISSYSTKRSAAELSQLRHFMEELIDEHKTTASQSAKISQREVNDKLRMCNEILENEKTALQQHIAELEKENERLSTLLEKKKRMIGKDRRFTLLQIVDYCKRCVEWNDAKYIVAMLNKLLRHIGTTEDEKLVDSIEEEFRNRANGNTYINTQTVIPSVGNYQPQISTQNMNLSMPSTGQEEQKLLEDE